MALVLTGNHGNQQFLKYTVHKSFSILSCFRRSPVYCGLISSRIQRNGQVSGARQTSPRHCGLYPYRHV